MEEEKKDSLAPILDVYVLQAPDKESAQKALITLQKGHEGSIKLLEGITEVTAENRESVIATLSTIKQYYDKIKRTREPITKYLDELKKELMRYERPSDYNDKNSMYSQKRALVEVYDESVRKAAEAQKQIAEKEKRITVHLAEVKAAIQRSCVDMITARKKLVIERMADWEKKLTLENIEESEKNLTARTPKLDPEVYESRFKEPWLKFQKMIIIPPVTFAEMESEAIEQRIPEAEWNETWTRLNDEEYARFIAEVKKEETYEKYNEEYVRMVSEIVNAVRARIPEIRKELQSSKDRQAEIDKRAQEAKAQITEQAEQKAEAITQEKDLNVMEAEFVQQATTQELNTGPTEKYVEFEKGQFLKPFSEMVGHCISHPDFPGIFKKGKTEYVDGVKFWITMYERLCMDKPVKGLVVKERARTVVKAKKE